VRQASAAEPNFRENLLAKVAKRALNHSYQKRPSLLKK
jgi:hypothetical protein